MTAPPLQANGLVKDVFSSQSLLDKLEGALHCAALYSGGAGGWRVG